MPNTRFRLSTLPALAGFLVQRAQGNAQLQAALDDGLADYEEGAQVMLTALRALLDEYLEEGQQLLFQTNQFAEPYKWLAMTDQLEVVQTFRNLLGED
ncbi:hypothetical protein I2I05_18890 [Hymenobacter sp. BT683]|uniref:Uncharacterized protein n=1 Tax=Hymenobacter jeongseonensis TaxID=2791027 RepID=A0ABS0IM73_9BACT|nr:hypothetical protein [Hymenobacter jeongseonensis]MBF9239467.1 hypothetical protein [Hymenobacter jeongseonensis]